MIDEADRDGDGEVSQEEFLRIMKKTSLYWVDLRPLDVFFASCTSFFIQVSISLFSSFYYIEIKYFLTIFIGIF